MSTSIRNRLPGTIEKIVSDKVVSELVIRTAAGDVTSIITTGSVKRMNLKEGDTVFAIIKASHSFIVALHTFAVPSLLPVTIRFPSGEKATDVT
jgi:molybdopterin-binding protein